MAEAGDPAGAWAMVPAVKLIPPLAQRTAAPPAAAHGARLGWLDALRGIAALIVALHHFDVLRMLPFGGMVWRNFDMGLFGVMLFFIVSGYIIPASLERRGDVRGFWIGRIFRIYPALIAAFVLSIMMLPDGDGSVALLRTGDDLASLVANGLMLQDLLGVINGMNVTWTLCYEMVFYFFVTALFTRGLHRHSGPIAVALAGVALAVGTAVGTQLVSAELGSTRQLLLIVTPIVLVGLAEGAQRQPHADRDGRPAAHAASAWCWSRSTAGPPPSKPG